MTVTRGNGYVGAMPWTMTTMIMITIKQSRVNIRGLQIFGPLMITLSLFRQQRQINMTDMHSNLQIVTQMFNLLLRQTLR